MRRNIISELESQCSFMRPAERRIADFILNDPRKITELSMVELAESCSVSQGSVVNFSKKLTGGGFPTLKLRVAEAIAILPEESRIDGEYTEMQKTLEKMLSGATRAMRNTFEVNSDETLSRVADLIMQASRVEFCGLFRSAVIATDFCYGLIGIGIPATYIGDVLISAASASLLTPDSVLIAISLSGDTKDVIDACHAAKENGVPIVGITCDRNSPLATLSDEVLISAEPGGVEYYGKASAVRISQMMLVATVCAYIENKIAERESGKQSRLRNILDSHRVYEIRDNLEEKI